LRQKEGLKGMNVKREESNPTVKMGSMAFLMASEKDCPWHWPLCGDAVVTISVHIKSLSTTPDS
jgi:hypothetical protein